MAEIHLKQHPHLYLEDKQLAVASIQTNAMSNIYVIMDSMFETKKKILAGAHHIASVSPVQVLSGLVLEQRSLLRGRKTTSTGCEVDEAARLFNLCSSAHFGREVLRQVPGRASLGEGSQSSWRRRIGAST